METLALLETMKKYAMIHNIPIIEQGSMNWLATFLSHQKIKNVLEIGGAIGYSAIYFQHVTQAHVLSVEKDAQRYAQAQIFLQDFSGKAQIAFIHGDAKDEAFFKMVQTHAPYDVLFIDATKRNNQYFFDTFAPFIVSDGYIITDNLNFHGLANIDEQTIAQLPRRIRPMVRAVIDYRQWLKENNQFTTEFIATGDGLAVSQKIR